MRIALVSILLLFGPPLIAADLFSTSGFIQAGQRTFPFNSSSSNLAGTSDGLGFANGEIQSEVDDSNGGSFARSPVSSVREFSDDYTDPAAIFDLNGTASETLRTAGPVRSGIISYQLMTGGGHYQDMVNGYTTTITAYSEAGVSDGIHTYGQEGCQGYCPTAFIQAPFELGGVFSSLSYADEYGTVGAPSQFGAFGKISYSLFEADGVTPVAILETPEGTPAVPVNLATPEPGTIATSGLALASMLGLLASRRGQSRSRSPFSEEL